jgi:hypothetical protein
MERKLLQKNVIGLVTLTLKLAFLLALFPLASIASEIGKNTPNRKMQNSTNSDSYPKCEPGTLRQALGLFCNGNIEKCSREYFEFFGGFSPNTNVYHCSTSLLACSKLRTPADRQSCLRSLHYHNDQDFVDQFNSCLLDITRNLGICMQQKRVLRCNSRDITEPFDEPHMQTLSVQKTACERLNSLIKFRDGQEFSVDSCLEENFKENGKVIPFTRSAIDTCLLKDKKLQNEYFNPSDASHPSPKEIKSCWRRLRNKKVKDCNYRDKIAPTCTAIPGDFPMSCIEDRPPIDPNFNLKEDSTNEKSPPVEPRVLPKEFPPKGEPSAGKPETGHPEENLSADYSADAKYCKERSKGNQEWYDDCMSGRNADRLLRRVIKPLDLE